MQLSQRYPLIAVLFLTLISLLSCRAKSSVDAQTQKQSEPVKTSQPVNDDKEIVDETLGHFKVQTYTAIVNISKVYKSGVRLDDLLRVYTKLDQEDHVRVLISIKPQPERMGSGMLAEIRNNQVVSGYRFIPQTSTVVPINSKQKFSNVVIGGLSLQDFQMVQGVSPFTEMRIADREEINGKACDVIEIVPGDQGQYHHGQLFTTVAERLPVMLRAFDKNGAVLKEIVFDKLEQTGKTWVVKQLTVLEKNFAYTSTFKFENVEINSRLDDSVFTTDFLQKGWQEPSEKAK